MASPEERREAYRQALLNSPRVGALVGSMALEGEDPARAAARLVLAPAVGGFLQWLLGLALERGWRRLCFLARDGALLYRGASLLVRQLGLPLECRYLAVSRRGLWLPLWRWDRGLALELLCRKGRGKTLGEMLSWAGLAGEDGEAVARSLGLPLGEALAPGQLKELGQSLGRCSVFLQGADRQGARAGEAFAAYLAQEGLLDGSPWVAVDSGWMGSTQESLGKILQGLGQGWTLEGCYWGLYRSPNKMPAHCWYFSPHNGWREKAWFANSLVEALLGASHGTVLGYRQGAGRVLPVCGPEDGTRKDLFRKTEPVYQGYFRLLGEHSRREELLDRGREDLALARRTLPLLLGRPTREEAAAFGGLNYSDGGQADREAMARPLPPGRRNLGGCLAGAWPQGAAALTWEDPGRRFEAIALYQLLRAAKAAGR